MPCIRATRKQRLIAAMVISLSFFVAELVAGFYTHSLALVADAFHYLSDLLGLAVALVALMASEHTQPPPKEYTFGWQRATLLGAFFNGVFLLALGVSILVQAIERFTHIAPIDSPKVVLILGCVGLGLNVLVMSFLHEHDPSRDHNHEYGRPTENGEGSAPPISAGEAVAQLATVSLMGRSRAQHPLEAKATDYAQSHHEHKHTATTPMHPGRDLGMLGALIHVIGDAINNLGVIVAALVIWKADGEARYYVDPALGVLIAITIFATALPLTKRSGRILLEVAPSGINVEDIRHDLELIPGVESIHELHIWGLDQQKSIASAHVVVDCDSLRRFTDKAKIIMECLHAYDIHSATLQPEMLHPDEAYASSAQPEGQCAFPPRQGDLSHCRIICGERCEGKRCCTPACIKSSRHLDC